MAFPNFELVSPLQNLERRDFPLVDESILAPIGGNPLVDGEWLELNNWKLQRGASGEGTSPLVFPVHTERGRYDTQAILRVDVIFLGMYEADTKVINTAGLSIGTALTVQDVTYLGATKRGLAAAGATSGRTVVGYVSRLMGNGTVRFVHFGNQKL